MPRGKRGLLASAVECIVCQPRGAGALTRHPVVPSQALNTTSSDNCGISAVGFNSEASLMLCLSAMCMLLHSAQLHTIVPIVHQLIGVL